MKKISILLILAFFSFTGTAQTRTTIAEVISGKIINEVTNEPISYTNIGLENTFIGTASNAEGNFQLEIPKDMVDRNIYFSALGFKNDTFPVSQLFNKEYIIVKLEPRSYDIEDVDIAEKSRVPFRILRMASENAPYNFIGGPFNLLAGYQNKKIIDDTITTTQNIDVLLYDKTG
ncbi:MAG: carboxypeptidase-like regulatory domain-containing protein, partial [Prolixibacteraceae bacterium]